MQRADNVMPATIQVVMHAVVPFVIFGAFFPSFININHYIPNKLNLYANGTFSNEKQQESKKCTSSSNNKENN